MEHLTANITAAKARLVREAGKEWLVAPATSIVEGVLSGSQGPLLYPADEISRNVAAWDLVPITLFHPSDPITNEPLPAKAPGVPARQWIGDVRNSVYRGKLQHALWFDVERTRAADSRFGTDVYGKLTRGEPIELSTGLYTRNDEAPPNSNHNGRLYTHVARDYRPDHIAVLPGQVGACSVADGCGVLINSGAAARPSVFDRFLAVCNRLLGNAGGGGQPSDAIDPDKACEILHDGEANGKPLTDDQRRMFGAACGQGGTHNAGAPAARDVLGLVTNAAVADVLSGQPRHGETGQYLPHGSGTGKGPVHAAAVRGADHAGAKLEGEENEPGDDGRDTTDVSPKPADDLGGAADDHQNPRSSPGNLEVRAKELGIHNALDSDNDDQRKAMFARMAEEGGEASAKAETASRSAAQKKTTTAHYAAKDAHLEAGAAARKAGNDKLADKHFAAAEGHGNAAKRLDIRNQRGAPDALDAYLAYNRDWPQGKRDKLDDKDFAGPGQSYPIATQADVDSAAKLVGKAADPAAVKKRIIAIAKRKGLSIPDAWKETTDNQGGYEAVDPATDQHAASKQAAQMTVGTEHGDAQDRALAAVKASADGKPKQAAKEHLGAAEQHEAAATQARQDKDPEAADMHDRAAAQHRKAASMCQATRNQSTQGKQSKGQPMTITTKEQAIKKLTANCKCEADKAALNALSEETLLALARNAKAEGSNADATGGGTVQAGGEEDSESEDEFTDKVKVKEKGGAAVGNRKTADQWFADAPPEIRAAVQNAMRIEQTERRRLVDRLVANVGNAEQKAALSAKLMRKPLDELQETLALVPVANAQPQWSDLQALYLGAAGGPVANVAAPASDDLLDLPTMNYGPEAGAGAKTAAPA